ncbi:mediator of DNA damage checkpoint protein 1 [Drosophila grimshawi]|uniref:mediator of DNA damage checkpoint protein 1 n=1 Tax=Drosophila grimshawi TaxID=7222 RepID=UPI000C86ECED|nr:mediator of DNA damage checkpoint protein 1 [Drosophila grimshawi]
MKVSFRIDDNNNRSAVQLEPDIIYRIGRRLGLELHSDDETMELAHATIALLADGNVRLSAVAGKVFVNGLETGEEIKNISKIDAVDGIVNLSFGKVAAKLHFNAVNHLDIEAAYDTSGFEESTKDKTVNTTADSLNIPETEPQSINTTGNRDSFIIPETQFVNLNRSSMASKASMSSMGEDFLIPETQDVLLENPVQLQQHPDKNIASDEESSELGTQIRICTQDFNEINEDAIDDFDSSLLLGDGGLTVLPTLGQAKDNKNGADLEMSALNWSASNSKCTALNSTKADEVSTRGDICLTPDQSVAGQRSNELEDVPSTPDIFELIGDEPNERQSNEPGTSNRDDTQQLSVAKLPAAANIETPESNPLEQEDNSQDFIETQAFPARNAISVQPNLLDSDDSMQEFFEAPRLITGFIENQATTAMAKPNQSSATRLSIAAQVHNNFEDFIETQPFPTKKPLTTSSPYTKANKTPENMQDFIATQAFIRPPPKSMPKSNEILRPNLNSSAEIHSNEDLKETQLFIPPTKKTDKTADNENVADSLQFSLNLSLRDDLDAELKELISLSPLMNTPSDFEQQNKFDFDEDKMQEKKISQSKEVPIQPGSKQGAQQKAAKNSGCKRSATRSKSPEMSPSKKNCTEQLPESSTLPGKAVAEIKTPAIATRTRQKRCTESSGEPTAPPKKARSQRTLPTVASTVDAITKTGKSADEQVSNERRHGRQRKTSTITPKLTESSSETNTESTHQSEESVKDLKRSDTESASGSKVSKERKLKQSKDDKPSIGEATKPVSRRAGQKSHIGDVVIKIKRQKISTSMNSALQEDTSFAAATSKEKAMTSTSQEVANASSKRAARVRKTVNSSEISQEEEPSTSAEARKLSIRRKNLPRKGQLKDINDYIKNIKSSGRKIRLSLTMCNNAELHTVLSYLRNNVEISNDPLTCDLLIMDKGERTYKFLVAIASNKPVLSSRWLHALRETRSIVVKSEHIFSDAKFEDIFKFKPLSVLEKPSLLKGLNFMLGNDILPNANEMKAIIQCAGGHVYTRAPSVASIVPFYVVTSKKEKKLWSHLRDYTNVHYIKTEGVMQALLQVNLELLDEHKLTF